ncbi:hypothetical protein KFK09_004624 [Dendrobium nobile]|uniref:Uncharacterized protein n=1 Tax=Dendrobium nobile TaxID=94219 RepID=A0A8T3C6L6_DENNO|nr:hypothetical protein KFK09_004624 [Dendrobium nobile]
MHQLVATRKLGMHQLLRLGSWKARNLSRAARCRTVKLEDRGEHNHNTWILFCWLIIKETK